MAVYRVRAKNGAGKTLSLLRESASEDALVQSLAREGLFPTEILQDTASPGGGGGLKTGRKNIEEFTATLALMLESGLSLKDSLDVSRRTAGKGKLRELSEVILMRIAKGDSFSKSLDALRGFPPVYRGLVNVGERTGNLETVIRELSGYLEEERKIREKVSNALAYPLLVLVSALSGMVFLSIGLLPRISEMFAGFGALGTGRVNEIASTMRTMSIALSAFAAAGVTAFITLFIAGKRSERAGIAIDRALFSLPLAGGFLMRKEMLSFTFAMEALTSSGVGVEDALEEASRVVTNRALRQELMTIRSEIVRGVRFSDAVGASRILPGQAKIWIGIGEETGAVEKVFAQLGRYYRRELESFSSRLMVLVEPAVILLVGIIVIFLVTSFIVPLFSLFGSVLE